GRGPFRRQGLPHRDQPDHQVPRRHPRGGADHLLCQHAQRRRGLPAAGSRADLAWRRALTLETTLAEPGPDHNGPEGPVEATVASEEASADPAGAVRPDPAGAAEPDQAGAGQPDQAGAAPSETDTPAIPGLDPGEAVPGGV